MAIKHGVYIYIYLIIKIIDIIKLINRKQVRLVEKLIHLIIIYVNAAVTKLICNQSKFAKIIRIPRISA